MGYEEDLLYAAQGTQVPYGRFSYLVGPDGAKVELVTAAEPNAPPIAHHHVHFINKQYVEMQQWYMKAFNATLDRYTLADVTGNQEELAGLLFAKPLPRTKARATA